MTHRLAGKRMLIVEEEHLFADYLVDAMAAEGAEVIKTAATVNAALDIIANTFLDGVTLDLKLKGEMTLSVADTLAARNIPFIFLTGYGAADFRDDGSELGVAQCFFEAGEDRLLVSRFDIDHPVRRESSLP
jgi:DNA-binding response OmpR family regulator